MAQALRVPEPEPPGCPVCGCPSVETDAVEGALPHQRLQLSECPRCDHRWTQPLGPGRVWSTRAPLRVLREGASAA